MRTGVDVASYQGTIDFDALKADASFVFSKATEGVGFRDGTFNRNWTETKRVGLIRGAYHFARPDLGNTAQTEATWFLSAIGPVDGSDVLALDYEVNWDGDVVGWCRTWLNNVKAMTGITPLLYLNMSLIKAHDWSSVFSYPLWLAYYDGDPVNNPPTPWPVTIKQFTSDGHVAGIGGRVDLNTWFVEDEMAVPMRIGQSADLQLKVGEVGLLQAFFAYDMNTTKNIQRKVWAHRPGRYVCEIRPPVDPDADPTEHIDAEPAIFVVDVLAQ